MSGLSARRNRWVWITVCSVILVGGLIFVAGWLALRWIDEGMTGIHVSEDPAAAKRLAEGLGLQLGEDDRVVYGELQSSFPDSGSYLVVATRTPADRDRLLATSSMSCSREAPAAYGETRSVADHGPGPSTALLTCRSEVSGRGVLFATYDPEAADAGTRIYIQASEM